MPFSLSKILTCPRIIVGLAFFGAFATPLAASPRTSTNYIIVAESTDGGGSQGYSLNYTSHGTLGAVNSLATVATPSETLKSGYLGELYQVTGLILSPTFTDNGTTQQLSALQTLDDGTNLPLLEPNESWTVISGQIPAGLTLNSSTGVISGTPTGTGSYSFTVQVTDGIGDSAQQTFSGNGPIQAFATSDTPAMPAWALAVLGLLLYATAGRSLKRAALT